MGNEFQNVLIQIYKFNLLKTRFTKIRPLSWMIYSEARALWHLS